VSDVYPVQVAGTHPNKPSRGAVKNWASLGITWMMRRALLQVLGRGGRGGNASWF